MTTTNYLIIGSGIAGLTFALKMATRFPDKRITIITKSNTDESNTKYAQGGIAIVVDETLDSYNKHINDTLICGDGLCNKEVVEMVITQGPKCLNELIKWGAQFDKNDKGDFDLGKEGGHSVNRVVHHKDQTGYEIERAILQQVHQKQNISVLDYHFAIDLIIENNCCFGIYAMNEKTNEIITVLSDITLLSTGGIGHVYGHTSNPIIATGDGIAMAFRANAVIKDMEFIQFHPTTLYDTISRTSFLISEAVRGFGAYLRTMKGDRFMFKYDARGELASRDIISQSIAAELKKSNEVCVYLDCSHLNLMDFIKHFPMIYERCKNIGIDITKDWIPVIPAQHYLCGGIVINKNGETSVDKLFACGECAQTGLHGANRLASNSLLEALVYSDNIYNYLTETNFEIQKFKKAISNSKLDLKPIADSDFIAITKDKLQTLMRQNVGIVRYEAELFKSYYQLIKWDNEIQKMFKTYQANIALYELNNMITVAKLIVGQSIERNENRGVFLKLAVN